jgi:antitoxin (DNA-binding transcriptional repressor) of toxin-antitoxin stability system
MGAYPAGLRVSTSKARVQLSEIIRQVQDPRSFCVLTRHEKPVAAIVSMAELHRIWKQQDIEGVIYGKKRLASFTYGPGLAYRTNAEAAEAIQQIQLDRRTEREVLAKAGLDPVPGGEIEAEGLVAAAPEVEEVAAKRRWWWVW